MIIISVVALGSGIFRDEGHDTIALLCGCAALMTTSRDHSTTGFGRCSGDFGEQSGVIRNGKPPPDAC
jgi:hypothetical protein